MHKFHEALVSQPEPNWYSAARPSALGGRLASLSPCVVGGISWFSKLIVRYSLAGGLDWWVGDLRPPRSHQFRGKLNYKTMELVKWRPASQHRRAFSRAKVPTMHLQILQFAEEVAKEKARLFCFNLALSTP